MPLESTGENLFLIMPEVLLISEEPELNGARQSQNQKHSVYYY